NKIDALDKKTLGTRKRALEKASGGAVHLISGATGEGIKDVLRALHAEIMEDRKAAEPVEAKSWQP
ncbi:MAG: GTPase ObgE, partial [Gemmobacter sp.]